MLSFLRGTELSRALGNAPGLKVIYDYVIVEARDQCDENERDPRTGN